MEKRTVPEDIKANDTVASEFKKGLRSNLIAATTTGIVGGVLAALAAAWALVLTVPGKVGLVPSGAVVAFNLKGGCPSGWVSYKEGSGRFIIGAAGEAELSQIPGDFTVDKAGARIEARAFGKPGGEQKHKLTVNEMPEHKHLQQLRVNPGVDNYGDMAGQSKLLLGNGVENGSAPFTSPEGKGDAHDIMPPYVPLYWCEKQ